MNKHRRVLFMMRHTKNKAAHMDIIPHFDLTPHNTLGLTARAQLGARITSGDQVDVLAKRAAAEGLPLRIIGEGSNIILRDTTPAVVGIMASKGIVVREADDDFIVTAQAGENWSDFVDWTIAHGMGGLENLTSIPGTVGAAPIQNIGAYGLEVADRMQSLTAYDTDRQQTCTFNRDDCAFSYRQSMFKRTANRYIVLDVTFALPKKWQPILNYAGLDTLPPGADAAAIRDRVASIRRDKLPDWKVLGNVGSFFHNPIVPAAQAEKIEGVPKYAQANTTDVKLSAAWLIEACGLKGHRDGAVGTYDKHALIVVNHGGGTYADITRLSDKIKQAVYDRFQVQLTREPLEL